MSATTQDRCYLCKRFVYKGQLWCRDCAPITPCRDFPPTCAPFQGECCMEAAARERITAQTVLPHRIVEP